MKIACMLGHSWMSAPDATGPYPVLVCRRCAKRKEMAGQPIKTTMVRARSGTRRQR